MSRIDSEGSEQRKALSKKARGVLRTHGFTIPPKVKSAPLVGALTFEKKQAVKAKRAAARGRFGKTKISDDGDNRFAGIGDDVANHERWSSVMEEESDRFWGSDFCRAGFYPGGVGRGNV